MPVSRSSLTAILRLAELGLVHADHAVMADAQRAIEQIRAVLASGTESLAGDVDARPESHAERHVQNEMRPPLKLQAAERPLAIDGPQESAGHGSSGE